MSYYYIRVFVPVERILRLGFASHRCVIENKRTDLLGDDMGDSIQDLLLSEGRHSDRFLFEPALGVLDEFVEGWVYANEPTHNPPFSFPFQLHTRSAGVHV